jgi:putative SOS response-associated peptidase YedK
VERRASQELLIIRRNHQTGEVSLDPLRWALFPNGVVDSAGGRKSINAKCGLCEWEACPKKRNDYMGWQGIPLFGDH